LFYFLFTKSLYGPCRPFPKRTSKSGVYHALCRDHDLCPMLLSDLWNFWVLCSPELDGCDRYNIFQYFICGFTVQVLMIAAWNYLWEFSIFLFSVFHKKLDSEVMDDGYLIGEQNFCSTWSDCGFCFPQQLGTVLTHNRVDGHAEANVCIHRDLKPLFPELQLSIQKDRFILFFPILAYF
jgi:hypothetical protein